MGKNFDRIRKEREQIEAYLQKIKELQDRQREREEQFALKVGKLVLKTLNNDVDEIEAFTEWLEVYLHGESEDKSDDDYELESGGEI